MSKPQLSQARAGPVDLPIWFYLSVTGLLVYFLLYHVYG